MLKTNDVMRGLLLTGAIGLILGLGNAAHADDDDDDEGGRCDITGSWLIGNPGATSALVTYSGSRTKGFGTKDQESFRLDPQFRFGFPETPCLYNMAEALTSFRGEWTELRGDDDDDDDDDEGGVQQVKSVVIGYGIRPTGFPFVNEPACAVRISALKTFSDDCNTLNDEVTFDFFEPTQDVNYDTPVASMSGTAVERRILHP